MTVCPEYSKNGVAKVKNTMTAEELTILYEDNPFLANFNEFLDLKPNPHYS